MSDFVKGFVSAKLTSVSLNFNPDYASKFDVKAGRSQGPTLFINKGTSTKEQFPTAKKALEKAVKAIAEGKLPKETRVYANGEKMTVSKASKLDLKGFQFWNSKYQTAPKWSISFMTDEYAKAKNEAYAKEEDAKYLLSAEANAPRTKATKKLPLF
tara:strand:- start:194 stop:661 length:468 start_codon:yes stop_codon:yes gene_type:complete